MHEEVIRPVTRTPPVPVAYRHGWTLAWLSALLASGAAMPLPGRADVVSSTAMFNIFDNYTGAFGAASSVKLYDFQIISLPRFDSALGTLDSVSIGFASRSVGRISGSASDNTLEGDFIPLPPFIINERNDAYFGASMSTSLTLQLFDPSSSTVTRNLPVNAMGCAVSGPDSLACQDKNDAFIDFNGAMAIAALGLNAFTGSDPINLLATVDGRFSGNCDVDDRGDSCSIYGQVDWMGTVTVAYTYSLLDGGGGGVGGGGAGGGGGGTGAVPEPGSFALVGLGCLGLLGAARARRRA